MYRVIAGLAALAIGATIVYAQNADAIAARKAAMKEYGAAAKAPGGMVKGDVPFNLTAVQDSLLKIQATSAKGKQVFPDDSKNGETDALPAAFENKADLFAKFDKLAADAKAAAGAIKDEASFKSEWPKVVGNCGGCHKAYRKPKQ